MTADLMSGVCYRVSIEPCLQAVTEEQLMHKSSNKEDGAHLGIVVETFGEEIGNVHFLLSRFSTPLRKATSAHP